MALVIGLCAIHGRAQTIVATTDRSDGIYQIGQTVQFRVALTNATAATAVNYVIKKGAFTEVASGSLELTNGAGVVETRLTEPGTLLAEFRSGASRQPRTLAGVVVAPEKIAAAGPRPADFDAFWESKVKELQAIPTNAKLETVEAGKPGVDYWKISMDNIRGTHIQGQLARPKLGEKFPALLIVQWAGVYALQKNWVTDRAAEGWLALNINPHELPIDQSAAFYREQSAGPLSNYPTIGNEDRETSYFLRMYLSCYRAADYFAGRPDWDGKTLVVTGTSQGGLQSLMLAGFHSKITAALALVPAGCDMRGPDAGRAPGWPQWYYNTQGKDAAKVRHAGEYYDVVNFAPRVTCPVLVGLGLIDETSRPAGILAALNLMRGPKEIVIMPRADHQGTRNTHAAYLSRFNAVLADLRQGKAPAIKP